MMSLLLSVALGASLPVPTVAAGGPPVTTGEPTKTPEPPTRAKGSLPGLFTTDDYPREALRNGETGTVAFNVVVNRDGRVTQCDVTTSSGSPSLDRTTCTVVQSRARFTPARDAKGRRVADTAVGRIRWQLPLAEPEPVQDRVSGIVYALSARGKVAGCKLEGAADENDIQACASLMKVANSYVADVKGHLSLAKRELVLEFGQLVGGIESARGVGRGEGQILGSLVAVAVTVDAAGEVKECVAAEGNMTADDVGPLCANNRRAPYLPLDPAVPDRSDRHLVVYQAAYLRPVR
jgi:TonB family protein